MTVVAETRSPRVIGASVQLGLPFLAIFGFWFVAIAVSAGQGRVAVVCCWPFAVLLFWAVWQSQNTSADVDTIILDGFKFAAAATLGMITGHSVRAFIKARLHAVRPQTMDEPLPAQATLFMPFEVAPPLSAPRRLPRRSDRADSSDKRAHRMRRPPVSQAELVLPVSIRPVLDTEFPKQQFA